MSGSEMADHRFGDDIIPTGGTETLATQPCRDEGPVCLTDPPYAIHTGHEGEKTKGDPLFMVGQSALYAVSLNTSASQRL